MVSLGLRDEKMRASIHEAADNIEQKNSNIELNLESR